MNEKYFIITIDTEGDNLWKWKPGDIVSTENTLYLMRFQELCDKYAFKPVWLTNYEMIMDSRYLSFIMNVIERNKGELGMHLHAWNSPPFYELNKVHNGAPYLIEYPPEIMEEKISFITDLIHKRTGIKPVSHRAGRWAMNQLYFDLLYKNGYVIDCSFTPHINWENAVGQSEGSRGSDYSNIIERAQLITCNGTKNNTIYEVPVTIKNMRSFILPNKPSIYSYFSEFYHCLGKRLFWMRPKKNNLSKMLEVYRQSMRDGDEYIMFMLHSSELMPGGSPTFQTEHDIDDLFKSLDNLFNTISKTHRGITLQDYYMTKKAFL